MTEPSAKGSKVSIDTLIARLGQETERRQRDIAGSEATDPAPSRVDSAPPPPTEAAAAAAAAGTLRLKDLFILHDRRFLNEVYHLVLGREADGPGMHHHLAKLRAGTSKEEIIALLRFSREGRRRAVRIRGLLLGLAPHLAYRIPVIGYGIKLVVGLLQLPKLMDHVRRVDQFALGREEDLAARIEALEQSRGALQSRLEQVERDDKKVRKGQAQELTTQQETLEKGEDSEKAGPSLRSES